MLKVYGDVNDAKPDYKNYPQDIVLFDFETFGATNWQQIQDNYDNFTFTNNGKIRIWEDVQGNIIELFNKELQTNHVIKMENINDTGYIVFNNLDEYNYPFKKGSAQHESGYHFKTQIIFYNYGVKLKMKINYELWIMGTNRFTFGSSTNGNFEINTTPMAYLNLKQK